MLYTVEVMYLCSPVKCSGIQFCDHARCLVCIRAADSGGTWTAVRIGVNGCAPHRTYMATLKLAVLYCFLIFLFASHKKLIIYVHFNFNYFMCMTDLNKKAVIKAFTGAVVLKLS